MNVLVVDDEKSMRDLASRTLTEAGYTVATAANGDEALNFLPGDFEIVLTDLDMPGSMTGVDLTKRVRGNSTIDVIIMTGFPDLTTAIEAVREGAYDYLVKPFSPHLNLFRLRLANVFFLLISLQTENLYRFHYGIMPRKEEQTENI